MVNMYHLIKEPYQQLTGLDLTVKKLDMDQPSKQLGPQEGNIPSAYTVLYFETGPH